MRHVLIAGAALAVTALSGCMLSGCASIVPASAALTATRGFVAAEAAFDGAIQLADQAVLSGQLPVAAVSKIKTDADAGYKAVLTGRDAVKAADAPDIAAATASLMALVSDLQTVAPKKGS